jgi:Tol biopolymer transport system component
MRAKLVVSLALGALVALGAAQKKNETPQALFGSAVHQEEAEGNLKEAIRLYETVLQKHGSDRKLAADALFRIGQCYERLGQAEARKAYERLIKEFSDQKDRVRDAQVRLSALERAGGIGHPSGMTLRKVWAIGRGELEGSPSPDGRYYSFTDWETGDLALRDLTTGQNRRLTNKGTWRNYEEWAEASVISGDGKQIAYAWYNEEKYYELRVIGIDGSNPRTVYRDKEFGSYIEPCQWTADGKQILATLRRIEKGGQIALIPAAGGPVRVLKIPKRFPKRPSLSPDGRFLVYEGWKVHERDIFLLSLEGGQEVPLVQSPADDFNPIWMPVGNKVLFVSDRTGTRGFWAIDVIDGKPEGLPQLLKDGVGQLIRPEGFTRQGSFYYSLNPRTQDVYLAEIDLAAGKLLRQPVPVASRLVGVNWAPSWSPDGRQLAYFRLGSTYEEETKLVILSIETGEAREVPVKLDLVHVHVHWFPDGKSVLVSAWESSRQDLGAFYRVDLQTGDHRLVRSSLGPGFVRSELSPDGKTLFFFYTPGEPKSGLGVISFDIETGQEREIARVPYVARIGWTMMAISPDGKYLAFRSPVDERQWTALRLVPATGGELRELCRLPLSETVDFTETAWTPDGQNVLMVRGTGERGMAELWRIPIAGGVPQRTGVSMIGMNLVAVHPNGKQIAFESGSRSHWGQGELWVLENFLAAAESKAVAGAK